MLTVLDNLESMPKVHRKVASERARTQRMQPQVFKTRRDVGRYFSGDTIECLICGRHFKRLQRHLAAKHGLSADDYKKQFGLPWTRGLTSATSLANSGWTDDRKAKARKFARKSHAPLPRRHAQSDNITSLLNHSRQGRAGRNNLQTSGRAGIRSPASPAAGRAPRAATQSPRRRAA